MEYLEFIGPRPSLQILKFVRRYLPLYVYHKYIFITFIEGSVSRKALVAKKDLTAVVGTVGSCSSLSVSSWSSTLYCTNIRCCGTVSKLNFILPFTRSCNCCVVNLYGKVFLTYLSEIIDLLFLWISKYQQSD